MRTPAGTECPFYYEDYHRGRRTQECRLINQNPASERWSPDLCARCPVPDIARANADPNLRLEAKVVRRLGLLRRVQVTAYCVRHACEVPEPALGCRQCREERQNIDLSRLFGDRGGR